VVGLGAYRYRPLTVAVLSPSERVAARLFGLGTVEARVVAKIGFKVAGTLTDLRGDLRRLRLEKVGFHTISCRF